MRNMRALIVGLAVCLALAGLVEAQSSLGKMLKPLKDVVGSAAGKSEGSSSNVAQGLKEALTEIEKNLETRENNGYFTDGKYISG